MSALVVSHVDSEGGLSTVGSVGRYDGPGRTESRSYPQVLAAMTEEVILELRADDPDNDPDENRLLAARGVCDALVIPLVVAGAPVGVLEALQDRPHRWSARAVTHLKGLGEVLGVVLAARR